jgi:hypothetical protein
MSRRGRGGGGGAKTHMECTDWKAFSLLMSAVFIIFADQNLMAPNLSQIARDFGMNEEERDRKLGGGGGQSTRGAWI